MANRLRASAIAQFNLRIRAGNDPGKNKECNKRITVAGGKEVTFCFRRTRCARRERSEDTRARDGRSVGAGAFPLPAIVAAERRSGRTFPFWVPVSRRANFPPFIGWESPIVPVN